MRWLADENFNNDILRGLIRRMPNLDVVRVQDVGLTGASDETVLAWAAQEQRILLTHDVTTITQEAYRRLLKGEVLPGVFEVARSHPIGPIIEDLRLLEECSFETEWERRVSFLPLRPILLSDA